jgi:hypothetical protein
MPDYKNFSVPLTATGVQLDLVPELLPDTSWRALDNIQVTSEGMLATREGFTDVINTTSGTVAGGVQTLTKAFNSSGTGVYYAQAGTVLYGGTASPLASVVTGLSGAKDTLLQFRSKLIATPTSSDRDARLFHANSSKMSTWVPGGTVNNWGIIRAPGVAPTVAAANVGGQKDSSLGTTYKVKFTYYNANSGAESMPSPASTALTVSGADDAIDITALNANDLYATMAPTQDTQITHYRVYISGGTMSDGEYHLAYSSTTSDTKIPVGTAFNWRFTEADADCALRDTAPEENYPAGPPVFDSSNAWTSAMKTNIAWGPYRGAYLFMTAPNKPGHVWHTSIHTPFGVGENTYTEVSAPDEPILSGFIYGENAYAWTGKNLYGLRVGSSIDDAITSYATPVGKGLFGSAWNFTVGPKVYFASYDGIYETDCVTPAKNISEKLRPIFGSFNTFQATSAIDYDPLYPVQLIYARGLLYAFYTTALGGTSNNVWIYDIEKERWTRMSCSNIPNANMTTAFWDTTVSSASSTDDLLFGGNDGYIYRTNPGTYVDDTGGAGNKAINVNVLTKAFTFNEPNSIKIFGNVLVDCNTHGNTVTMTPYYNGEATSGTPINFSSASRDAVPLSLAEAEGRSISLGFTWSGQVEIYNITIQYHDDEEKIKHWDSNQTNHGLSGLMMVKDAIISLNSSATVTLSVTAIGVEGAVTTETYSISSTSGVNKKVLVPLKPTLGYLFSYALDSSSSFRVYGEESELRVKPWKTSEGYNLVNPFA